MEITNCFPFPNQNKPENIDLGKILSRQSPMTSCSSLDVEQYQADIIRNLRRVNSDYLQVGFYDSSFNRSLAQSMVPHQLSGVEESVALVYGTHFRLCDGTRLHRCDIDQALALQGYISLKAYRLTPAALENLKIEEYFSPEK